MDTMREIMRAMLSDAAKVARETDNVIPVVTAIEHGDPSNGWKDGKRMVASMTIPLDTWLWG